MASFVIGDRVACKVGASYFYGIVKAHSSKTVKVHLDSGMDKSFPKADVFRCIKFGNYSKGVRSSKVEFTDKPFRDQLKAKKAEALGSNFLRGVALYLNDLVFGNKILVDEYTFVADSPLHLKDEKGKFKVLGYHNGTQKIIAIDKNLSPSAALEVVAHELVHAAQKAEGLKFNSQKEAHGSSFWKYKDALNAADIDLNETSDMRPMLRHRSVDGGKKAYIVGQVSSKGTFQGLVVTKTLWAAKTWANWYGLSIYEGDSFPTNLRVVKGWPGGSKTFKTYPSIPDGFNLLMPFPDLTYLVLYAGSFDLFSGPFRVKEVMAKVPKALLIFNGADERKVSNLMDEVLSDALNDKEDFEVSNVLMRIENTFRKGDYVKFSLEQEG